MRMAEIFLMWGEFRGICPRFHQFVEEHLDRGTFPWKMPQIQSATVVYKKKSTSVYVHKLQKGLSRMGGSAVFSQAKSIKSRKGRKAVRMGRRGSTRESGSRCGVAWQRTFITASRVLRAYTGRMQTQGKHRHPAHAGCRQKGRVPFPLSHDDDGLYGMGSSCLLMVCALSNALALMMR